MRFLPQTKHLHFAEIQISNTVVATYNKEEVRVGKGSGVEAKKKRKQKINA